RSSARVAEEAVTDVVYHGAVEGADAARARNPYRRMRLLDRPRPEIHVRELEVPPIPRKDLPRLPRLERQRELLAVPLTVLHRRDAVAQVDVHRAAQRQAGHESPAADAVEHGLLFGDTERRMGR